MVRFLPEESFRTDCYGCSEMLFGGGSCRVGASRLFCVVGQLTGFCMIGVSLKNS